MKKKANINQQIYQYVLSYFGGNHKKTWLWFTTVNHNFGMTPQEYMRIGRSEKLLKFVKAQIEGNHP